MARKIIPFTKPQCPGIFCEASTCVLEEAAKDGVKTYVQRMEDRAIQPCLFGQGGTCCRNCSFGPCMMIEDVPESIGICGATASTALRSPRARQSDWGKLGDRYSLAIDLLEEVGFERDAYVPYKIASSLPEGYLKRLELARCLSLRPELVIADEILSGLSMAEMATMTPLVEKLQMQEMTIIMIEHRLRELFSLCSRVIVMNFGVKIAEGVPEEVMETKRVKEAYLGMEIRE